MIKNDTSLNILSAAQSGNTDDIESCFERGDNLRARDENGWTALHHAAANGYLEVVKKIVEITKGPKIDAIEKDGYTALHIAAKYGHLDVVEYLEDQGAEIYARDNKGFTSLHFASEANHSKIVDFLIKKGTNVDTKSFLPNSGTPLTMAIASGANDTLKLLLEKGADPNFANRDRGPLYLALKVKNIIAVKLLVDHGAKVEGSDEMPQIRPLHKAIKYKFIEAIKILIEGGADLYKGGFSGSPIDYAAQNPPCEGFFKLLNDWGVKLPSDLFQDKLEDKYSGEAFKAAAQEIAEIYDSATTADDVGLVGLESSNV